MRVAVPIVFVAVPLLWLRGVTAAECQFPRTVAVATDRDHVTLAGDQAPSVAVSIAVVGADKTPCLDAQIVLHSTAGTVTPVVSEGPGKYVAQLSAPSEHFPQLVVVTAVDMSSIVPLDEHPGAATEREDVFAPAVGAAVVAYSAQIDLKGRTKPGATMQLNVGKRSFGPVRADPAGRFVLTILVPPGERYAQGISTDAIGNVGRSKVDLFLPEVPRIYGFFWPETLTADGKAESWLFVTTVDKNGAPESVELKAGAVRGAIRDLEHAAPGVWRMHYVAPQKIGDGGDDVRVYHAGLAVPGVLRVGLKAGPPRRLSLVEQPAPVAADGASILHLEIAAVDAFDNPAGGQRLELHIGEQVVAGNEIKPGRYSVDVPPRTMIAQIQANARLLPVPAPGEETLSARVTSTAQGTAPELAVPLTWHLPTLVALRIDEVHRTAVQIRLRITAKGIKNVQGRVNVQVSQGTVSALGAVGDTMDVGVSSCRQSCDVVAVDNVTGVSAWRRLRQ